MSDARCTNACMSVSVVFSFPLPLFFTPIQCVQCKTEGLDFIPIHSMRKQSGLIFKEF